MAKNLEVESNNYLDLGSDVDVVEEEEELVCHMGILNNCNGFVLLKRTIMD